MNILFIGDIYGRPGRQALKKALPDLRARYAADFVVVNGENSAGGKGINEKITRELLGPLGVDAITGGNHSFYVRGMDDLYNSEPRLLRPHNFPEGTPGTGFGVFTSDAGFPVAVINLCGRTFMQPYDDPFRMAVRLADEAARETPLIVVDFHAEATSEKVAMGWMLDGRVTAVIGTHTHVPTADEAVLPGGTAYITDAGMTGPYSGVIGADREPVLAAMLTLRPKRFEVAPPVDVRVCGVFIEANPTTGRALRIERVRVDYPAL